MPRISVLYTARWTAVAAMALWLSGCSQSSDYTPDPASALSNRPWVYERELLADPSLEVTPQHVVVLHLAGTHAGNAKVRREIAYRFEDTTTYTFCIPENEPYIEAAELFRRGAKEPLVRIVADGECVTKAVEPGRYRLVIESDSRGIPDEGAPAFVHVPRTKAEPQQLVGVTPAVSTPGGLTACNALAAVVTPDNRYLVRGSGSPYPAVIAQADSVDLATGGWQICPDNTGAFELYLTGPTPQVLEENTFGAQAIFAESDGRLTIHNNTVEPYTTLFDLVDLGDAEFLFSNAAFTNGQVAPGGPIVVAADGTLHWTTTAAQQAFSIPVLYYPPGVTPPPPQTGEVSLTHGGNHGTWIVRANLPSTGIYYNNPQLGTREYLEQSTTGILVQPGPLTVVSFYGASDYRLPLQSIGSDEWAPFSEFFSLQLSASRDFIIATNRCLYCNLTGIDLSEMDLSSGYFEGSTFVGANLASTKFIEADLKNANFSGPTTILYLADFADAFIGYDNTSFRSTDVSQANFKTTIYPIGWFSPYRPDFTGATLSLNTFNLSDWAFINLTGAIIQGVQGATLSTTASPLDLRGAVLDHVNLKSVVLDGANLGCTNATPDGTPVCTSLSGVDLNRASLKKTIFVDANLQGADLDFANLDGSNLCNAKLNLSIDTSKSASLQGAFLRNANLYQADLSGANLSNASLFSSFPNSSATCSTQNCAPTSTCASISQATLNNATFAGAYLAGADFSSASPQGVDFEGAYLLGANFTSANLDEDPNTGRVTNFRQAYLQGTNFTSARVKDANFTSAYVDLSKGGTLVMQLPSANTQFAGYQHSTGSTPGCVEFTYNLTTTVPNTDATNACPDGSGGSCSQQQWTKPELPIPVLPANCNAGTVDFDWVFD